MADLLEVDGLTIHFGGLTAVNDLSFKVRRGDIRGLIGPNGAGKTTTFNLISGFYKPSAGRIAYKGENIAGMSMHRVAARGLVRTFQHSTLFHELTLIENVLIGCHLEHRPGIAGAVFGGDLDRRRAAIQKAEEVLDFFGLSERRDDLAAELPHGLQRALGMAIALASEPELILLDEPFTGMNPTETRHMMTLMRKVRDSGVTILLVEHDMNAVMGLCDNITVMSFGRLLAEGGPDDIRRHPKVIEAYLGGVNHAA